MKRLQSSIVIAIIATVVSLIASVPAFRILFRSDKSTTVKDAPVDVEKVYSPSGWMGDALAGKEIFQADFRNAERTRPGDSDGKVMRFSYRPGPVGWAGIAWLNPDDNWGDSAGLKIRGARRISFWAMGENGGETVEFKFGGAHDPTKRYHDSFEKQLGPTVLTTEWRQYSIDLTNADLDNIIVGFVWVAAQETNPTGLTFFLDSIRIE